MHLGQFHLELGLVGLGARGENIEDQFRAIQNFDPVHEGAVGFFVDDLFEAADLAGGKIVVEDDDVGVFLHREGGDFLDFAAADVGAGINALAALRAWSRRPLPRRFWRAKLVRRVDRADRLLIWAKSRRPGWRARGGR